jgi:hypothetical protein
MRFPRFSGNRRVLLAGFAVLVLATAGGIAYAAIPDASGVIHGCYKKSSPNQGTLRVIDTERGQTCSSSENALSWNQTGPKGATGPTGPTGPSDGYSASNDYMRVGGDDTTLVSVDVPAGSYTVAAKTHVYNAVENSFAICELRAAGDAIDGNINRLIAPANDQVVPFLGVASLAEGGTIALVCNGNGVTTVESENSRLVATKVGTLH